ncbi:MAG: cytochrome c-type biogenesis protein CcmH [Actinomycetota bacterium]
MRRAAAVILAGALLAAGAALGFAAVRGPAAARNMDDRVHGVASTLRCPVCHDLSVADSPSLVARQMRETIARRLRAGQSPGEIRDFFVSRFGPTVLLTPQGGGAGLAAWIFPVLLSLGGLAVLGMTVVRWSRPGSLGAGEPPISPEERSRLERELAEVEEPGWA